MGTSRTSPSKFNESSPAAIILARGFIVIEIIEHCSVVVSSVGVDGREDLPRVGEPEHGAHVHGPVDVLRPLHFAILYHGAVLR